MDGDTSRGGRYPGQTHLSAGGHGCVNGELTLSEEVLEVAEHSQTEWVFHFEAFYVCHVAGYFGSTFTESHYAVVEESPGVVIGREGISKSYEIKKKSE